MPHTSFMDDFKTVYNEKGKHDLKAQIPFLSKLADRYKKKGKKDPRKHWSDLLKAHALYNSCAVREDDKDLKERWETACYKVQKMYWGQQVQTTQEQVLKVAADIREKLELLRTVMRRKLEPITKEIESWQSSFQYLKDSTDNPKIPFDLCQQIKTISLYCNNVMVGIAKAVIGESIKFCGNPPCEFSAVAFGSLAKGEATPYSDLEYLFLIAEQKDVSIKYFELLAVTSYFIIGNVQETKLKYMNVDELQSGKWFEDEAKCGFKIDGLSVKAGNIPTGNNMPGTPRNYLIVTPGQLLQRYTEMLDNPEQNLEQPGDLTDMLSYMKEFYNHGRSKSLYSDFCKSISTIKPNPLRKDASLEMLQQDIRSYDFIPGDPLKFQTRSHSLNLKTDIYRYPSIIIYDLKIVFGMKQPEDSWETLLLMRTVGALSESLYGCLLFLLCSAQYIRFAAYLHYNSQQDKISVLLERANRVRRPSGSGSWHLPRGLLYRICLLLTSTKLHIQLGMLKEPMDFQRYISAIGFYKIIEEPENIIECVHHQYPNLQGLDIFTMYELAQAHTKLFDFENGAMFFDILEVTVLHSLFELDTQLFFKKFRGMQRTLFSLNLSLANVLICSGKTEYAKEILQRVSSYDMDQKERQDFECLKVDLLHSTGETTRAIEHLEYVASESEHEDNCSIGEDNLEQEYRFRMKRAILMKDAGSLKKAGKQLDAALKLVQNIYGLESRHPDIANVFEHLAEVEIALKNYDKAENYLAEAEQVFTADEQVHRHQFLRIELYMGRKDFKQALAYVLKLVNVIEKPAKKVKIPSHQQGKVYMLMGLIFLNLGKTVTAEHKLKQAISFYLIPIPDSNQNIIVPELEQTMYILADCCLQNLKPLEALHCIRNCLGGLNELLSRKPDINPGYLHDIDGTLSAVIKALWREAELSTESDDHKADIRHCFILLSSIYTMKKNDGQAIRFMAEADKY